MNIMHRAKNYNDPAHHDISGSPADSLLPASTPSIISPAQSYRWRNHHPPLLNLSKVFKTDYINSRIKNDGLTIRLTILVCRVPVGQTAELACEVAQHWGQNIRQSVDLINWQTYQTKLSKSSLMNQTSWVRCAFGNVFIIRQSDNRISSQSDFMMNLQPDDLIIW